MRKPNQIIYERTKDGLQISGDADKVTPFIKSDQRLQWFRTIAGMPFNWAGKITGLNLLWEYLRRIRSG